MPDTTSTNLLLTIQTVGGNNNTWGTIANTNYSQTDHKLGDVTSISTTGGSTTLTSTQEIVNVISVSGTLVSNATIVFSGRGGSWVIKNATSGDYTLTCKVSGQTGVTVTQGGSQVVFMGGTDIELGGAQSTATAIPSGFGPVPYCGTTAPSGWVRANGRTIGNGSSSATERANADTSALFVVLWNAFANAQLAVQDSSGTPTTRGASAAADFAANRRITLPDLRGRAVFGLDDMGNTAASRIGTILTSATTNGYSGGTETVTLATANLPAHTHTGPSHTHTFTTGNQSADHTHTFSGTTSSNGAHTHTVAVSQGAAGASGSGGGSTASSSNTTSSSDGAHTHTYSGTTAGVSAGHTHTGTTDAGGTGTTGSTGSDTAHSNMPPAWLQTFIIKL